MRRRRKRSEKDACQKYNDEFMYLVGTTYAAAEIEGRPNGIYVRFSANGRTSGYFHAPLGFGTKVVSFSALGHCAGQAPFPLVPCLYCWP